MGRRGPAPTPTAIKLLRGTPVQYPLNDREPKPTRKRPRCPMTLTGNARAAWRQLVPMLDDMGVLTVADAHALTRYCVLWARWREAERFIARNGTTYQIKDDAGEVKYIAQFPHVAIAHRLALQLTRLEQEFGMTPASRTRIRVEAPAPGNVLDTFLTGERGGA